jgi:hypothetical protein
MKHKHGKQDVAAAVGAADAPDHTPVAEMERLVKEGKAHLEAIREKFFKLVRLTPDQRSSSSGRLREGEETALRAIAAAADLRPHVVECLADADFGDDPTQFEVQLLSDRLARRGLLDDMRAAIADLESQFADTILHTGALVKPPLLDAYKLLRPVAKSDKALNTVLQPATTYYAKIAKKSAKTLRKKRKQAAKAA